MNEDMHEKNMSQMIEENKQLINKDCIKKGMNYERNKIMDLKHSVLKEWSN